MTTTNQTPEPVSNELPPLNLPPCKGMNCGCTDGRSHSAECQAEHAACVAGGKFVKDKPVSGERGELIRMLGEIEHYCTDARFTSFLSDEAGELFHKIKSLAQDAAALLERIYSQPVELPDHIHSLNSGTFAPLYTSDQLTQAVQEATARALEAAAKECDTAAELLGRLNNLVGLDEVTAVGKSIRNLIGRVK